MSESYSSYSFNGFIKNMSKQKPSKLLLFFTIILFLKTYETKMFIPTETVFL